MYLGLSPKPHTTSYGLGARVPPVKGRDAQCFSLLGKHLAFLIPLEQDYSHNLRQSRGITY